VLALAITMVIVSFFSASYVSYKCGKKDAFDEILPLWRLTETLEEATPKELIDELGKREIEYLPEREL
jgi:hypothetical protein